MSPKIDAAAQFIEYGMGGFTLGFDAQTGAWIYWAYKGRPLLEGGSGLSEVTLLVDGTTTLTRTQFHLDNIRDAKPIAHELRLVSHHLCEDGIPTLTLLLQGGGWCVEERFQYVAAHERIERSFTIGNHTGETALLRNITSRMPVVADMLDCTLEMPGYPDILHQSCAALPYGRFDALPILAETEEPTWRPGLLGAVMPGVHINAWMYGDEMPTFWQIYKGDAGVWFEQLWQCPARLETGNTLEVGIQYLSAGEGSFADELMFMQDFWAEKGVALKQPTPAWAKNACIYEAVVGVKSFRRNNAQYSPYPTVEDLIADLKRIHSMGFDVLELMPQFPFPNYSVHDYYDIDVHYGSKGGVKELITQAHALGMRVFLDVVMHGVIDQSLSSRAIYERHPLLDSHPEFFSYTENGRVATTYTWAFDQANPGFREYMKDVFCYYITELDADGFRVDAIHWNFFPNWAEGLSYPAYKALCGQFGMFAGVRDAARAIKPDVVFYTETTGPLSANAYDLFYNYDEIWLYECLIPLAMNNLALSCPPSHRRELPAIDARGAAEWLDLRKKATPRGTIRVRHADSHDTHEWLGLGAFRREYFGPRQTLALFAFCCFTEGALMNFVGGEIGFEQEYAELMRLRKASRALSSDTCDYLAVKSNHPRLFTPLRTEDGETMIPIINFSESTSVGELDLSFLSSTCPNGCKLIERFSNVEVSLGNESLSRFRVSLAPYAYELWQIVAT